MRRLQKLFTPITKRSFEETHKNQHAKMNADELGKGVVQMKNGTMVYNGDTALVQVDLYNGHLPLIYPANMREAEIEDTIVPEHYIQHIAAVTAQTIALHNPIADRVVMKFKVPDATPAITHALTYRGATINISSNEEKVLCYQKSTNSWAVI